MTVRVYSVFDKFAPAVTVGDKIVPVLVANRRKWDDRGELEDALRNRGYAPLDASTGDWEHVGQRSGARGRPATETLESQARRRTT